MNRPAAAAAALLALVVPGCGSEAQAGPELLVLAAASLSEVLPALAPEAQFSFAGSDELAAQVRAGAPADVLVSAAPSYARELFAEGLVEEPRPFALNRLVIAVPRDNPAGIEAPSDLAQPGVRLVLGAEGVPAGDYAREALAALGLEEALANVVSEEPDVKGVVAKVSLGLADAGLVYATDAVAVAGDVRVVELPGAAQPRIEYVAAVVRASHQAGEARRFVDRLLSSEGRAALGAAGFGLP